MVKQSLPKVVGKGIGSKVDENETRFFTFYMCSHVPMYKIKFFMLVRICFSNPSQMNSSDCGIQHVRQRHRREIKLSHQKPSRYKYAHARPVVTFVFQLIKENFLKSVNIYSTVYEVSRLEVLNLSSSSFKAKKQKGKIKPLSFKRIIYKGQIIITHLLMGFIYLNRNFRDPIVHLTFSAEAQFTC